MCSLSLSYPIVAHSKHIPIILKLTPLFSLPEVHRSIQSKYFWQLSYKTCCIISGDIYFGLYHLLYRCHESL